ncbi:CpsD/CapB family tyrosine-protein kinase [uncultured Clostridium sp.]|jgi:capsular exopolysaccharide synthesis family protein|uniref:CpsD/CapB family tyrosine-protein kinase n=1 Tax=uncultured Clostridium sp. TaxID=59620 RepID=UPI0026200690|nr:CpsD/CapB family tyrosine-protein kinase [uncultured Clostridium sp.]
MFIVEKEPKSVAAEAYKTLRTNIQYSAYHENLKTLLVTSSNPQEGKSITAGNLAISFAQDGKKVVIIDCDLRRPTMHKKFNISNEAGLTELLLRRKEVTDCIQVHSDNLDIITSGKIPPNPSELLGSDHMKKLLVELKERYDYIIIDTPPVLAVSDAQVLAANTDGVVFVVKSSETKKEDIIQAKANLDKVNAPIVGSVLNGADSKKGKYKYNYEYYGEDAQTKKKCRIFGMKKRA